jgi:hypothetical protein
MKEVTMEEFGQKMREHLFDEYHPELHGWQIGIMHGLACLVADHPGVQKMSQPTQGTIREVRDWCLQIFGQWGFTAEEIEWLDKMREVEHSANTSTSSRST